MLLQEAVTGIRPLAWSLDEAVLHRVPMYVRHVMVEVGIVTNTIPQYRLCHTAHSRRLTRVADGTERR